MTDLIESEADKYRRVWSSPDYRRVSPGMMEAERAFIGMGCQPGETLTDYGSGTCRATKWFQDKGLDVLGIDHAGNAGEEPTVPVLIDCLWDLTVMAPRSAYGFCCDVMEHIPPEKVDAVLANIARLTTRHAWFRIATRLDVMGPQLIGEPLHLSVHNGGWWHAKLCEHFPVVETIRVDGQDAVFMCSGILE